MHFLTSSQKILPCMQFFYLKYEEFWLVGDLFSLKYETILACRWFIRMFGRPWRAKSMAGQQWKPRTTTTVENRGPEKSWLHCSWARQNVQGTGGLQEEHAGGDVPWGVPSGRKSCDDPQWIRSDRGELTKNKKSPETSSLFYEVLCDDYASCNPTLKPIVLSW